MKFLPLRPGAALHLATDTKTWEFVITKTSLRLVHMNFQVNSNPTPGEVLDLEKEGKICRLQVLCVSQC